MASSQGDPRVHFVMNLVLSTAFSAIVVWGLSVVGGLAFNWVNVAAVAVVVMVATYLVTG